MATEQTGTPSKRPEYWTKAVQKGTHLLQMMLADDQTAGQMLTPGRQSVESSFLSAQEISSAGYSQSEYTSALQYLRKALQAIGVDDRIVSEGGRNKASQYTYGESSSPETGGVYFILATSITDGMLIAISNYSPTAVAIIEDPSDALTSGMPALKYWSDVAFLHWSASAPDEASITGLKYVIRSSIQNPKTNAVINRVLASHSQDINPWPGLTIEANTEGGRAILGTPNGSGTAYLLIEHKRQLGHKIVGRITIFCEENPKDIFRWPSILMHICEV